MALLPPPPKAEDIIQIIQSKPDITVSELQGLVGQVDISQGIGDSTIFYTGKIGGLDTGDIAYDIADQHSNIGIINNTEAAELLEDKRFTDALEGALKRANPTFDQVKIDALIKENLFKTDGGMWSIASEKLASHAQGDIIVVISPDAKLDRIFAQNELPKLLENPNVHTINGIDKFELKKIYETKGLDAAMHNVTARGGTMLNTLEKGTDSTGNTVYKTDKFLQNIDGVQGSDFPSGTTNIKEFSDLFKPTGTYGKWYSDIKSHIGDIIVSGPFVKIGIAAEILDIVLTSAKAEAAIEAGRPSDAAHIVGQWASEFLGGAWAGGAAAQFFGKMILKGTPVGKAIGLTLTLASAIGGSEVAKFVYNKVVDIGVAIITTTIELAEAVNDWWHELSIHDLSDSISAAYREFLDAIKWSRIDPLIIDLAGNGIKLDSWQQSTVLFDLDGNGTKENTGWTKAGGDDVFLVIDKNNNGNIDSLSEMFGNATTRGFIDLKSYDSNNDNLINSSDTQFSLLKLWNDKDADGVVDSGEMTTLAANGVTEISLNKYNSMVNIAGNIQSGISTVTINGTIKTIHELNFAFESLNPAISANRDATLPSTFQLNIASIMLPYSRGYGSLYSWQAAMTLDPTLLAMAQDLVATKPSDF